MVRSRVVRSCRARRDGARVGTAHCRSPGTDGVRASVRRRALAATDADRILSTNRPVLQRDNEVKQGENHCNDGQDEDHRIGRVSLGTDEDEDHR